MNDNTFTVTLTEAELKAIAAERRRELDRKVKNVQARSGNVKSSLGIMTNTNVLIRKGHLRYNAK